MILNVCTFVFFQMCWIVLVRSDVFILPDGYVKCNISDSNFTSCATTSLGKLVSMGVKGIPALGIKSLEPVFIANASFKTTPNSPVSMQLELKNLTFYGFGSLTVISAEGTDLRKNVIQMEGLIPEAKVVANYTMNGRILSLPLQGSGNTVVILRKMKLAYKTVHRRVKKHDRTFLPIANITLDATVEGGSVMYKSNQKSNILGLSDKDVNDALNENFMILYSEYAPVINELLLEVITPRVVKFNNEVPLNDLFIE